VRRLGAALGALALFSAACDGGGGNAPQGEVAVRVTAGATAIDFGKAFPLEVVRAWDARLVVDEWDDRALAPLVVRLESATRRDDGRRVVETRRYAAYAFERGEVTVPAPSVTARPPGGGRERTATGEALRLEVRSSLGAEEPGAIEPPTTELMEEPRRWVLPVAVAAAIAAAVAVAWARRRRPVAAVEVAPRGASPRERAMARIAALRARVPRTRDDVREWHVEAAAVVRDYLAAEHGIAAPALTTVELARAHVDDDLVRVVAECELAVYARHEPTDGERRELLAGAERGITAAAAPSAPRS